ncbi:MAG: hypothetical protein CM1200mP18_20850 [Gammaproteobacteria bacterium]|nr:MAG: hypothetical protein CM1200mP18_20850 [Gammaproteobacteria bacterium]
MPDTAPMLELHDVEVRFNLKRTGLFGAVPQLRAVDGFSGRFKGSDHGHCG